MNSPKLPWFDMVDLRSRIRLPFRTSLNLKLLLIIGGVLLIGVATSYFLVLNLQRQQLIDGSQNESTLASSAIQATLEHAMLSNDLPMANHIAMSIVREGGLERVSVLNTAGIVRISSDPAEIDKQYDRGQVVCQGCHLNGEAPTVMNTVYNSSSGHPVLLTVKPIRFETQCGQCHDPQIQVLGLLLTETSLAELSDELTASEVRIILSAVVTFVLMAGLMLMALKRFVINPVTNLAKGMAAVGSGNLSYRVPLTEKDELGDLAVAFDRMRRHLKESRAEITRSNRELAILHEVALATGHVAERDQILQSVLEIIVGKLHMQTGLIYLWRASQKRFERVLSLGLSQDQLEEIDRRRNREGGDLTGEVAGQGNVHYVPDMSTSQHFQGLFDDLSRRAYVNVPLQSQGKIVGTLELSTLPGHQLSEREIEIAKAVGFEIGIAIENTALWTETRRNEREATALYEMGTEISASLELERVLNVIADCARRIVAAEIGLIGLVDSDQKCVLVKAYAGVQGQSLGRTPLRIDSRVFALNQPFIVQAEDPSTSVSDGLAELFKAEGVAALLAVPFWRGPSLRGLVGIMTKQPAHFSNEQVRLLTRFAQQTSAAVENAQLYERVQYVTVLEERERIAREIHDGLAQMVGSLRVWAEEAELSLDEENWKACRVAIKKVEDTARDAYASLREEMMGLRETIVPGKGILPVLAEYLSRFRREWGIQPRFQIQRHDNSQDPIYLSPNVEIQLLRIVQEGLTNVRRHANAHNVLVDWAESAETLKICIHDDGRGFSPEVVSEGHFGLRIMKERAASVGGQIKISSELGRGTRLEIDLPRNGTAHPQRSTP